MSSVLDTLSILVHAKSKVGKSTLAATAPKPLVLFDAEGSTKFLPLRKIAWDPLRTPPPQYDGTWEAAIVNVHDFDVLAEGYRWLLTGQHQFRSLVLDSVTEGQRKLKTKLVGANKMDRSDWDELLRQMDSVVRGLRDLTQHPINPIWVAVFVSETRLGEQGKFYPYMQGQLASSLPYFLDIVSYMWVEPLLGPSGEALLDPAGRPAKVRRLGIAPDHPMYEAGERVQGRLPDVIDHPDITQMFLTIYPHLAQPVG